MHLMDISELLRGLCIGGDLGLVVFVMILSIHLVMLAHVPHPLIMAVKVGWKSHQSQR